MSQSKERQELLKEQRDANLHSQNMGQMTRDDGHLDAQWLREITNHQLDEGTELLMQNFLTQDLILGNLQSAEVTEMKWLIRELSEEIKRMHPGTECEITGEARKAYLDDTKEALKPLSNVQENWVDQAVLVIISNVTRSLDGFQQTKFSEQVKVSKVEDDDADSKLGGFFS